MHSICFSIFDTLVQPSVPGQTLSSHTSAGEPTTLWGVGCSDIEQPLWCNITGEEDHFLWAYLRLPLIIVFADGCLFVLLNWLAFGNLIGY